MAYFYSEMPFASEQSQLLGDLLAFIFSAFLFIFIALVSSLKSLCLRVALVRICPASPQGSVDACCATKNKSFPALAACAARQQRPLAIVERLEQLMVFVLALTVL